jgi:hypothetical protein
VSLLRIVSAEKARFPVSLMCEVLEPDRSCHAEAEVADEPRSRRYRLNSGDGEVRTHGRGG